MRRYRAVLLALFAVGGAMGAAVPAGATDAAAVGTNPHVGDAGPLDAGTGLADALQMVPTNNSTGNSSLGADISSFMQSSAAEVGGTVDTGMWTAAFNATRNESKRVALVERRTGQLRSRLADLERRKAELVDERETTNVSETAYKAKVSQLIGRIDALRSAINATAERAERVNAQVEALEALRTQTENLTGPEIAAVARNLTGVGDGPPAPTVGARNGPGNGTNLDNGNGSGNGAATAETATTGNATANAGQQESGDRSGSSSEGGPPGDRGNSSSANDSAVGTAADAPAAGTSATPREVDGSTPTALEATPPSGLTEEVGDAVDAAAEAVDRALSAIPG